ncbi:DUF5107 domain-containing protein [Nocardioides coralli]|uniref:DUF5107 domain-containing protein n=1 Tax=Nocardioides coralli TaxID=2872154 RepID=UPI001CA421D3|nr:DUF5107 domain-containing protein [Nocardioides coralli]QZY28587.1 DUF5107 domain-containing protein [Nocardioides coralli]
MTAVRVRPTQLTVPGSPVGEEDPFPHLGAVRALPVPRLDPTAPADMRERVSYGRLATALPYARFNGYDRRTTPQTLPALELTNGVLTATVLPGLGGRVWSLRDERSGRELLHRNPVLRFANFGLTDAWFAGGIEWNLGSTGHTCLSTRPVHAAVLHLPDGDALRLWEWERTRDLVLQVDLGLEGSRLVASTRVLNPDPEAKPLYYWTNIAVPETPGTRVLCPAEHAWRTAYDGALDRVAFPVPDGDGVDVSRPGASVHAADYFFDVGDRSGRLVAAVEADGLGLLQTSTDRLAGRKLFVWGAGPGGTRWQEWLSGPDRRYCEIQAGACPTQLEHDVLPGGASVSWTETFEPLRLEPEVVAGPYDDACAAAAEVAHGAGRPAALERHHRRWLGEVADRAPDEVLAHGSGWGHAEVLLRGGDWQHRAALPFAEVDDTSAVAVAVLRDEPDERLDALAPARTVPPVSDRWLAVLRARPAHWWVDLAIAVNEHLRGRLDEAEERYRRSAALRPTAVAERGQAQVALAQGRTEAAVEHYTTARRLDPEARTPATEQLELLLDLGRPEDCLEVVEELPDGVRHHGRTRLLRARALADLGRSADAAAIMDDLEVPDLAEGARDLDELWARVRPDQPVPPHLDFRMVREEGTR